jgi:ketosteroid isomerase-like protein
MDNAALVALWADDGISLLPSTKPIVGKVAIAAFIDSVTNQNKGAQMEKFELKCFAIDVSGDIASEWCSEHQVVLMPGGKPPFDGFGKMLLVLRRDPDGKWRLQREMWNQAEAN